MRPKTIVAGAALAVAFALVAAPGFVGSRTPVSYQPVPAAALQALKINANAGSAVSIPRIDAAFNSAGRIGPDARFAEPAPSAAPVVLVLQRTRTQPDPPLREVYKPARDTLHGTASFYDAGFTAMRLPRGTVIRVCGAGGCLVRTITDYGPVAKTGRIIDMYRPDFFRICGCASWSGTTKVTVYVY